MVVFVSYDRRMNTSTSRPSSPTIIITGASAGIGEVAARELAGEARVIIVGRSPATKTIADELGLEYFRADFSNLDSVRKLAADLLVACPQIDLLINNAGGILKSVSDTDDGFEATFQVNYLAQFLLTDLLMERLIASDAGIINTSSAANLGARLLPANVQMAGNPFGAYCNSKLLDLIHAKELSRRFGSQGIMAVSFHPGVVATSFASQTTGLFASMYNTFLKRFLKTPLEGADTMLWLARNRNDWVAGGYYANRKIARSHKLAQDDAAMRKIWSDTQELLATV